MTRCCLLLTLAFSATLAFWAPRAGAAPPAGFHDAARGDVPILESTKPPGWAMP